MSKQIWHDKPYYSLDAWCKNTFKHKCYKVALNAHMTCPNRDGHLDTRGCIFCSAGGSGDFAVDLSSESDDITVQLNEGIKNISTKIPTSLDDIPYAIAYFQAYTNTYAPLPYLEDIFSSALSSPVVCGISIATRPDCIPDEVIHLLQRLRDQYPDKFIWIELGLQTIHEASAEYIRRGYPLSCFEDAFLRLRQAAFPVIVHTIIGLPGETTSQILETIEYLNKWQPFGIKLQLLHVLQNTDLAIDYLKGNFELPTQEEYLSILIQCLEHLSPQTVVHRVTGDGAKKDLIAPLWSGNKREVLNSLHAQMKRQNSYQGKYYPDINSAL